MRINHKAYLLPIAFSAALLHSAFFKFGPLFDESLQQDQVFSAKFKALPARVSSGEVTANDAIGYASVSVPRYVGGTTKIIASTKRYVYANAVIVSLCLFFTAYLAQKAGHKKDSEL